jgi:hypothetical protein
MRFTASMLLAALLAFAPAASWAQGAAGGDKPKPSVEVILPTSPPDPSRPDPAAPGETGRIILDGRTVPCIYITSADLTGEYDRNAVAGDKKFKYKLLAVVGRVDRIEPSAGGPLVVLAGGKGQGGARFQFRPSQAERLLEVSRGDNVLLLGYCKGNGPASLDFDGVAFVKKIP